MKQPKKTESLFERKEPSAQLRTLRMTIKKKWFDMILSGEKLEEYRDANSDYWLDRLVEGEDTIKQFDALLLVNGYSPGAPWLLVQCLGITYGGGIEEWGGDPDGEYFVFELGKVLKSG